MERGQLKIHGKGNPFLLVPQASRLLLAHRSLPNVAGETPAVPGS
jgi:hypothetical protein